jgi:TolB-like protein
MRWSRVCALSVLLGAGWFAGTAAADEGRAALLRFQGPQAAKVRQNVQKGLRKAGVELVPLKQVNAIGKKTKGFANKAKRMNASVLVRTSMRRVQGRWIATTEIRNAKGKVVKKLKVGASSLTKVSNRVVQQLLKTGLMPMAATAEAAEPEAEPEPEPEPTAPTEPRLVVRPFKGTQASKVRVAVVRGLRNETLELYPNKRFVEQAKKLGVSLASEGGHIAPATKLAVSGLIEGDVLREEGIWSAYVRLVDGQSTKVVSQHYYEASTLSALMKVVQSNVGDDFRKDIRKLGVRVPGEVKIAPVTEVAAAPIEEDAKKDEAAITIKTPEPKKAQKKDRPAAADIEADFRVVRRTLRYNDVVSTDLRDYTLNAGPGVALKFQWYPGAHFTSGVGAQFGIDFEWERLFGIDSTRADGATFPTDSQQFLVGLRWRYPVARWEPFVVVDYGVHTFEFGVSGPPTSGQDITAGVPSVKYEFVRAGAGFRVALGKKETFILGAHIAFRGVFSLGGIESSVWFPQAKGNGMDTGLVAGFALPLGFEIRVGFDYRRYGLDLNPVPPDPPYIAGGAVDQYLGGTLGVAWRR